MTDIEFGSVEPNILVLRTLLATLLYDSSGSDHLLGVDC